MNVQLNAAKKCNRYMLFGCQTDANDNNHFLTLVTFDFFMFGYHHYFAATLFYSHY